VRGAPTSCSSKMERDSRLYLGSKPLPQQRSFRRLGATMLALVLVAAGVWLSREPLMRGAADLWIVSEPATRADVVAILGGGLDVRPFVAAELYKKGLVNKVLVSQVVEGRSTTVGGIPGHADLNRLLLLKLGVPETAIETFGEANRNTREEAAALRRWAEQHGVSQIIVPTEIFAARRVRWIFDREFPHHSVRLAIPSFEAPGYTRAEWWKTEAGMIAFQNEILKYLYYRVKY
jgi:uncharacterized SAM-binding protein YcdF (DUF218 family)